MIRTLFSLKALVVVLAGTAVSAMGLAIVLGNERGGRPPRLAYFRIADDQVAAGQNPGEFTQTTVRPVPWKPPVALYVRTAESFEGAIDDIERIVVERKPMLTDARDIARELMGLPPLPSREAQDQRAKQHYHVITITFTDSGARRFHDFARANEGGNFEVRVNDETLVVTRLEGPFEGRSSTMTSLEDDSSRLRDVLTPFGEHVTWK